MRYFPILADLFESARTFLQAGLDSFIDIKAGVSNSPYTWITRHGALATAIKVEGTFVDVKTSPDFLDALAGELRALVGNTGIEVKCTFFYGGPEHKYELLNQSKEYTKNLDEVCGLGWLYKNIISNYANYTEKEIAYIVIYSTPQSFTKEIIQLNKKSKQKFNSLSDYYSCVSIAGEMLSTHMARVDSFIDSVTNNSGNVRLSARKMSFKEVIEDNRRRFFPKTSYDWKAVVPSENKLRYLMHLDEGKNRASRINPENFTDYFAAPSVAKQIFDQKIDDDRNYINVSGDMVQIGNYVHQAFMIDRFPLEKKDFQNLFNRLIKIRKPFTYTFHMKAVKPNFWSHLSTKQAANNILSSFDFVGQSKTLQASWDYLLECKDNNETIVECSAGFCFSSHIENAEELTDSINAAEGALTGWGSTVISRKQADKVYMLMSTAGIGLCRNTPGQKAYAPLSEIMQMLPLTRPARPYKRGALPMRTLDGKFIPIALTTTEVGPNRSSFTVAPPRFGKSLFMSNRAICIIAESTTGRLPYISFFDIGKSSEGLLNTLKASLGAEKQHEVFIEDMDITEKYTVNLFDTPLGVRIPTDMWLAQITDMLTVICSIEGTPPVGLDNVLSQAVIRLYENYTDTSSAAKLYQRSDNLVVHDWLMRKGYPFTEKTIWWDIVDFMIEHNELELARVAQSYAVPVLRDLAPLLNSEEFTNDNTEKMMNGEPITKYISARLTGAAMKYHFLSGPTQMNVGMARIISIDFRKVKDAKGSGSSAILVLAYMVVMWQVYSRFAFNIGEIYKFGITESSRDPLENHFGKQNVEFLYDYHVKNFNQNKEDYKEIVIDEAHELTNSGSAIMRGFLKSLESLVRNGPKFNQAVALISQQAEDFMGTTDTEGNRYGSFAGLIEVKHILNLRYRQEQVVVDTIKNSFGINDRLMKRMENTRMPSKSGSEMYYMSRREGLIMCINLFNTLPASAVWINTSNNESRLLREKLTKTVGFRKAIDILSHFFPMESQYMSFMENLNFVILNSEGTIDREEIIQEFHQALLDGTFSQEVFLNR